MSGDTSSRPLGHALLDLAVGSTILCGDSEATLTALPDGCVDLVVTSPPYFNARPEYALYDDYAQYIEKMRRVFAQCHRLLTEGRFMVVNSSPVIVQRASRQGMSRRLAVPFDLHAVLVEIGFDFMDDIIWEKPAGAGSATQRGIRFARDRQPLQYKPAPVTEYVLVYRKRTDKLIDWNLRNCRDRSELEGSLVEDGYEVTNVWKLPPVSSPDHPAIFPEALSDRVVAYYSVKGDVVCDPFAGSGTVGASCVRLGRRFLLGDSEPRYIETIKRNASRWLGRAADSVQCVGTEAIESGLLL